MRKKIELEYIFSSSVKVLFSRLSTAAGLSEWFADDVIQKDGKFIFIWNGTEHPAILVDQKNNVFIRFRWEDSENPEEYFQFITDFTDTEDEADTIGLWNKQMDILHRNLGA